MKTFISAEDIEALAGQGVRELTVDEDTVLTAVARETAAQCGIRLVAPGGARTAGGVEALSRSPLPNVAQTIVSGKPKGCQHGPLDAAGASGSGRSGQQAGATGPVAGGRVVDDLIGAVKQMARVPGTR